MDETGGSTCSNCEGEVAGLTTAAANRGCRAIGYGGKPERCTQLRPAVVVLGAKLPQRTIHD